MSILSRDTAHPVLIETMPCGVAPDWQQHACLMIFCIAGRVPDPLRSPVHFERGPNLNTGTAFTVKTKTATSPRSRCRLQHAGETNYGMWLLSGIANNGDGLPIYVTNFGRTSFTTTMATAPSPMLRRRREWRRAMVGIGRILTMTTMESWICL